MTIVFFLYGALRSEIFSLYIQVGNLCKFLGFPRAAGIHTKLQRPVSLISNCRKNMNFSRHL